MKIANSWQDYRIVDSSNGQKLEYWGNVCLLRPDPQIIWNKSNDKIYTDPLTKGNSRAACYDLIDSLENRRKQAVTIMYMDLNRFKYVNDTYGHDKGDQLLCTFSEALEKTFGQIGFVGRMGGDEFIVYLTNVNNKKTAEKVAAKLCAAVSALSLEKEEWGEITASFGLAFGDGATTWATLYHQADVALYDAKEKGKNQYSVYSGE